MPPGRPARRRALAVLALMGLAGAGAFAQTAPGAPAANTQARPRLIAETSAIAPGQTTLIGVTFDIEPGWHTYWHGLNDTVPGAWIEFEAPEGFEVGPLQWPAPHRHVAHGMLLDHIYEGRVTLVAPLTAPADAPAGAADITARVNWTVCADVCLMGDATLQLSLPVAAAAAPGADADRFAEARRRIPRAPSPDDGITTSRAAGRIEVRVAGARRLAFYPHEKGPVLADLIHDGEARADVLTLRLASTEEREPLAGVLEIWRDNTDETELIELRIDVDGAAGPVERQQLPPAPQRADGA